MEIIDCGLFGTIMICVGFTFGFTLQKIQKSLGLGNGYNTNFELGYKKAQKEQEMIYSNKLQRLKEELTKNKF